MSDMTTLVIDKLSEYGFEINNQYPNKHGQHVILTNDMILFVRQDDKDISVSFQAITKPDVVARNILLLKEIEDLNQIHIMESFVFTDNQQLVYGDKAFKLIRKYIEKKAIEKYTQKLKYSAILTRNNSEIYTC